MTHLTVKRSRGRPRKPASPDSVPNSSDCSQDRIDRYSGEIFRLIKTLSLRAEKNPYWPYFKSLDDEGLKQLAEKLAYELPFFESLRGLVESKPTGRTGPKPKSAEALFITQVREVLAEQGVKIPAWKKSFGECSKLVDFCHALVAETTKKGISISWRTFEKAPKVGFRLIL